MNSPPNGYAYVKDGQVYHYHQGSILPNGASFAPKMPKTIIQPQHGEA
jgi:hypothetical protein